MSLRYTRKSVGDFKVHTLANACVSLSMVPELGGKIVSLKDRHSGREWLDGWSPVANRRLWRPTDPASYETGPGTGIDECLPTVLPCEIGSRFLPDHGELWNQSPEFAVDEEKGLFCRWKLRTLPLAFERRITLVGGKVHFDYRLENLEKEPTPFLWAWHPLFTWKRGDQIRLRAERDTCLSPGGGRLPWPESQPGQDLSRAHFPKGSTPAAKVFLGPMAEGQAGIRASNGASLMLEWPSDLFPYAGIWITRGFWKGLHHWAIEPTNAPVDRLADIFASEVTSASLLSPGELRTWTLTVCLQSP